MPTVIPPSPKKRFQYRLVEKLSIINKAKKAGWINPIAHQEGTSPCNVRRWLNQEQEIQKSVDQEKRKKITTSFRTKKAGRTPCMLQDNVETELLEFYKDRRGKNLPVTVRLLYVKWAQLQPDLLQVLSYNAARMRLYRFMERHNLTRRRATNQAQGLPTNQETIDDFVEYIREKMRVMRIGPDRVANFDETNCYFSPDLAYTIAEKGSRTVSVAKPDSAARCTVMLGGLMDGEKFPPYVIFLGTATGRVQGYCQDPSRYGWEDGLFYRAQKKAWMDEVCMVDWVTKVWGPFTKRVGGPTMLILDEAQTHLTPDVRQLLNSCGTEVEYIPPRYTSKLQPMDVGMNKPFKDRMRYCAEEFMITYGVNCKPVRRDVTQWIKQAWETIPNEVLVKTWRHI